MGFDRSRLPAPIEYYPSRGITLAGRGQWRTAGCPFHGSHDSLRINIESGAFVCMAMCGARGGDVLAYEMAVTGDGFIECAKRLGAWMGDGSPKQRRKPMPFSAFDALEVAVDELTFAFVLASDIRKGVVPPESDWLRLGRTTARLATILDWVKP